MHHSVACLLDIILIISENGISGVAKLFQRKTLTHARVQMYHAHRAIPGTDNIRHPPVAVHTADIFSCALVHILHREDDTAPPGPVFVKMSCH